MLAIVYQNKWCRIIQRDTFYILQSKQGKYNDQYFTTLSDAQKAVGITPILEKYTFTTK